MDPMGINYWETSKDSHIPVWLFKLARDLTRPGPQKKTEEGNFPYFMEI